MTQALLTALDEAADNAPDAEERSTIQAVKAAVAGLSINTIGGFVTALIAKLTGLT